MHGYFSYSSERKASITTEARVRCISMLKTLKCSSATLAVGLGNVWGYNFHFYEFTNLWRCKARHAQSEDTLTTSKHGRWYHVIAHVTAHDDAGSQRARQGLVWPFYNNALTRTNLSWAVVVHNTQTQADF